MRDDTVVVGDQEAFAEDLGSRAARAVGSTAQVRAILAGVLPLSSVLSTRLAQRGAVMLAWMAARLLRVLPRARVAASSSRARVVVVASGSVSVWNEHCKATMYGPGLTEGAAFLASGDERGLVTSAAGATSFVTHVVPKVNLAVFRIEDVALRCAS